MSESSELVVSCIAARQMNCSAQHAARRLFLHACDSRPRLACTTAKQVSFSSAARAANATQQMWIVLSGDHPHDPAVSPPRSAALKGLPAQRAGVQQAPGSTP